MASTTLPPLQHAFDSPSDDVPVPTHRNAELCLLPAEIRCMMLASPVLDSRDRKSLRLTCKSFDVFCASLLFHRIAMSCLTSDRDSFLNIADTPHLAQHVKELVWYQLPRGNNMVLTEDISDLDNNTPNLCISEPEDDIATIIPGLHRAIIDLFWMPLDDPESDEIDDHNIREFMPVLMRALSNMPHLSCFISEPMRPDRQLAQGSYPITAGLVSAQAGDWDCTLNDTLFFLLFPVMSNPESKIDKFRWVDHDIRQTMQWIPNSIFELGMGRNVTSIDLCLTWVPSENFQLERELYRAWLHSAIALKHFRLSHRHIWGSKPTDVSDIDLEFLFIGYNLAPGDCGQPPAERVCKEITFCTPWPDLESLTVNGLNGFDSLSLFVDEHSRTLRHLHLENCEISLVVINGLAALSNLNLHCVDFKDPHAHHLVSEDTMLQYLNGQISELPLSPCDACDTEDCLISTQQSSRGCVLGLNLDSNYWESDLGANKESDTDSEGSYNDSSV